MKRIYFINTALLAGTLLFSACGHKDSGNGHADLPAVEVSTAKVELRQHNRSQVLPGTVHPSEKATVAAKLMATVSRADFLIGQQVKDGDILVELEAREIDAKVEQAQAALAQIERNLTRENSLLEQSATTAETVRTLQDQRRMAQAQLDEAQTMESYKTIRAPFDGIITSKNVRRGDLASPGVPLLSVEGTGLQQVYVQVPDSLSAQATGSSISIEANGSVTKARLSEWSPAADPASRTRLAKLDLPEDANLRSGQYTRVNWPAGATESLWIPAAAHSRIGQVERVFVVTEGKLVLRIIKTGSRDGEWLQVLSGLNEGEIIVLSPSAELRDGQPILN
ncbi:MAG: efflux RND transporter periplasmic adaptor subunit [Puniceicoccaceae bacterium]